MLVCPSQRQWNALVTFSLWLRLIYQRTNIEACKFLAAKSRTVISFSVPPTFLRRLKIGNGRNLASPIITLPEMQKASPWEVDILSPEIKADRQYTGRNLTQRYPKPLPSPLIEVVDSTIEILYLPEVRGAFCEGNLFFSQWPCLIWFRWGDVPNKNEIWATTSRSTRAQN